MADFDPSWSQNPEPINQNKTVKVKKNAQQVDKINRSGVFER